MLSDVSLCISRKYKVSMNKSKSIWQGKNLPRTEKTDQFCQSFRTCQWETKKAVHIISPCSSIASSMVLRGYWDNYASHKN